MMIRIFAYRRTAAVDAAVFTQAVPLLGTSPASYTLYTEDSRDGLTLSELKDDVLRTPDDPLVLMPDPDHVAPEQKSQAEEILWFIQNSIPLIFLSCPVMLHEWRTQNTSHLRLLYQYLIGRSKTQVLTFTPPKGRRKKPYPKNWPALYEAWIKKEITARDMMKITGVARCTFYDMVHDYRKQLARKQEIDLSINQNTRA